METIVFITTALTCAIVAFVTWKHTPPMHAEKTCLQQTLEKVLDLEEYIKKLELKQEHTTRCILNRAVYICQPIHGLQISEEISFFDLYVVDNNGKQVEFKINRTKNPYRYLNYGSSNAEDHLPILLEFNCPIIFKYIEFHRLHIPNAKNVGVYLLLEGGKVRIPITNIKHIICNTVFLML